MDSLGFVRLTRALGAATLLGGLAGCGSLQKDIDVPLPAYANELVVECYLENGRVPRLTVTESVPYLDNSQAAAAGSYLLKLSNGQSVQLPADVAVKLVLPSGRTMNMAFKPGMDETTGKYYTHIGTAPITARAGQQFALDAQDQRGRHVTGTAVVPTFIPIDSVKYKFNAESDTSRRAYFMTKWTDPAATTDYYRLMLHKGRPSNNSETDNDIRDRLFNGQPYAQVTRYRFRPNDTVTATLYHVDSLYFDFRQSVRNARNANGNPFSQPSGIHSTVQGGVGVFTVLVKDQKRLILR
ncbi:DUF4249 domain-containing protein [Hymenobacter sp. BT559]|uniref:DUF4249 domain-containing protein n=1 Tax=Hymenobacter sp. BT559 TaxID=2795729 RepID=UPI0018ED1D49|nr:DUF4249 domain-containing protein [Hymenobacter sp. BT559]MBJ6144841.1 DUF4249 domain-containing protein [Hymenobacter sp. BT559]